MTKIEKLQKEIENLKEKEVKANETKKAIRKSIKEKMKKLKEEQDKIDLRNMEEFFKNDPFVKDDFEKWMARKSKKRS